MNVGELRSVADQYYRNGSMTEALDAYARLSEVNPQSVHAWHMRAAIHGMLGQFDDAVKCSEMALSINPGEAVIHANYGSALLGLDRHQDAVQAYRRALEISPDNAECLGKLGNIYLMMKDFAGAELCFRKLFDVDPASAEAASNLAYILKETGKLQESIEICEEQLSSGQKNRTLMVILLESCFLAGHLDEASRHIVVAMPLFPHISNFLYRVCRKLYDEAHYSECSDAIKAITELIPDSDYYRILLADCQIKLEQISAAAQTLEQVTGSDITLEACVALAGAYNDTGQSDKAESLLADTIGKHPDEEIPVALLSRRLVESGKNGEACVLLEEFLEGHPGSHRILVELGSVYEMNQDYAHAEERYKRATEIQPEYAIAYSRLGVLYQNMQRYPLARKNFEKAIQCDPGLLVARCSLAYLYCNNGEYAKAQDTYDGVLKREPDFEVAIAGKATVLERIGEQEASFGLVKPLIENGTQNIHSILAYAHVCSVEGEEASAAEMLERALNRHGILPNDRMHGYFMLGKLLDKFGRYDRAFHYYRKGNDLNRFPFDCEAHNRLVDYIETVFSYENIKDFPRSTNRTDRLVFIVGMPRSGTTLTEQILASHPDVFGAGELPHIRNIAAKIQCSSGKQQSFPLNIPSVSQEELDRFSLGYAGKLDSLAEGQKYITDKMPSNFMFLGLIELLFPNARILHCVRDPVDTCLSCYFQNFSHGQYFSYSQDDLAFYYKHYKRLMQHWKSVLSIPIMDIQYEQLVGDQESLSRKMVKFVGLEWHENCVDFHRSDRKIMTASYDQVRKPIYNTSVKRWKKYEPYLVTLVKKLAGLYG